MTMMRWDPFSSLVGMKRDLSCLLGGLGDENTTAEGTWRPAVDIFETKDNLVLRAELPGMSRDEVKISVENNVLTLKGERSFSDEVKREDYHRVERAYGSFCRSFTLPTEIDRGRIEARFENGVLEVTMPRKAEAMPKDIEIQVN